MCGICGVVGTERKDEAAIAVRRMLAAIHHRGPDEEGFLERPSVALGMRRLSIIDLAGGSQPVWNEDGRVAVVFNGEIYNFRELRESLLSSGHSFRTHSDTEVIVHAYEEWGADCARKFRGMFAFAIWDGRTNPARMLFARDRLGIKPLYYARVSGVLVFASEVRALLASELVPREISPSAVESYVLFGSVAEPETIVAGVFSLPPGYLLAIQDVTSPAGSPKRYWDFSSAAREPEFPPASSFSEASRRLRPLLEETVRGHLISDVPLGMFLSSGMDSVALAGLASRESGNLHTFTVVFPEQSFSEAPMARRAAEQFGTTHQEFMLSADDMLHRVDEAIEALDQPTMDGINTYFVSWVARQVGLKVALSGLGGDEVFGGYRTFSQTPRAARLRKLGHWTPEPIRSATAALAIKIAGVGQSSDAMRKALSLWRSPDVLPHAYFFTRTLFPPERCSKLLDHSLPPVFAGGDRNPAEDWRAWMAESAQMAEGLDSFAAVSCLEMRSYMVNTLLRDTDAVSMANSLEVRVPLLDHRLVEFVAALPLAAKYRAHQPKALLAEALSDVLPEEVVNQPKRTFTLPWEHWLHGPLGLRVAVSLGEVVDPLKPLLVPKAVRGAWQNFLVGQTNWARPWALYVLNEWVRRHLAKPSVEPVPTPESSRAMAGGVAGAAI
jgi:asparagine synthase (glutamine-hydrolysing)